MTRICPISQKECADSCAWNMGGMCAVAIGVVGAMGLKESLDELRSSIDDLTLCKLDEQQPVCTVEPVKTVIREINDGELDSYVERLNPLEIANTATDRQYKMFCEWCAERSLKPCTQLKLSRRLTSFHPFKVDGGMLVPIRRGA